MIISFDLDDTLISSHPEFLKSKKPALAKEVLRQGTFELFKLLKQNNHKVYIYTTSFRSIHYIRFLFLSYKLWPDKIINKQLHNKYLGTQQNLASKLPNKFGIDLHIDDSEGVGIEGVRFGFATLIIHPLDENWVKKIETAVFSKPIKQNTSVHR